MSTPNQPPSPALYRRIATEEAFAPPELLALYRKVLATPPVDPGFQHLMGFYMSSPSERAQHIMRCLQDLDQVRLQHMDESGIDVHVIGMTSPGVQILDRDTAVGFMPQANDILAAAVRRHPSRFVGMISVAPQDPQASAKEIERGVNQLGMHSVIINSHTHGEYLSDTKFWPIFEAAEAMGTPIYLHPNAMPAKMIQHFIEAGLDGAIYGFGVETGLHALRLMTSGVFDRFPKLQIVLGHMGEALPFWSYRLDYMHRATVNSKRYPSMGPVKRKPSEYLRENFHITNSGVASEAAIKFTQDLVGVDRVLYAMDYPYQYAVDEVRILDAMNMSDDVKMKFFQTNAEQLFSIPPAK